MKLVKNIHPDIYAKTIKKTNTYGVSAFAHMLIVGIVCREYIKFLPKQFVERYSLESFPLYVALHDLGKVSPGFQEMLRWYLGKSEYKSFDMIRDKYETCHANISAEHLLSESSLNERIYEEAECIAEIIRYHHGTKRSDERLDILSSDRFGIGDWIIKRNDIYTSLSDIFGHGEPFVDKFIGKGSGSESIRDVDVKYISGLLGVCDWLGSTEKYFPPEEFMKDELDIDLITEYANNAIRESGLDLDSVHTGLAFGDIFKSSDDIPYKANIIQREFTSVIDSPGLYVLEAPMGVGKTKASLYGAYKSLELGLVRGIYFGLPSQTTSNSMFSRYKDFVTNITDYCENDIRLVHGNQSLNIESNSGMRSWFNGNRMGTLSSYGLGTLDQGLMSVLCNMKHFFIRTFGLSNKCVILDEVHSYDIYTSSLLKEFVDQLISLDCVVIILSATLTSEGRGKLTGSVDKLDQYPLITKVVGDSVSYHFSKELVNNKSVNINHHIVESGDKFLYSRKSVITDCLDRISRGEMVLWIENTVHDAQEVFKRFEAVLGDRCGLLHSRFTNADRELNEDKWVGIYGKDGKRELGCILVSTQVCEQSIDIDADYLVTALCPSDMLIQRIGRLQRHDRGDRCEAECLILSHGAYGAFESNTCGNNLLYEFRNTVQSGSYVYDPYVLRRTYAVWKDLDTVSIPSDIRKLLELTYADVEISGVDVEFKRLRDNDINTQSSDALSSLMATGGHSSDDVGNFSDDEGAEDTTIYGTRRILQQTIDLIIATEVLGDNKFKLVDDSVVTLSNSMSFEDKVAVSKNTVKVSNRFTTASYVYAVEIERRVYYYCIERDGMLVDRTDSSVLAQYTSQLGFVN